MDWDTISKAIDESEREYPTMDIHSKPGTKVIFKYPENGDDYDMKWASGVLSVGETYTVENIQIGQSSSLVDFKEFPEWQFNTVHFVNVEQEKKTSEFTGWGRSSDIDFGDYVEIEMHRYGAPNEMFIHKVVGALKSNAWIDAPLKWDSNLTSHDNMEPVLNVIQCGIDETKVIRVATKYCKRIEK